MVRPPTTSALAGWTILLTLGVVAPAGAESAAARFAAEAKRLEGEIAAAQTAWQEQYRLYDQLLAAARRLESGFVDPDATAAELRALEDRYSVALEGTYRQARLTSDARRRVYDGMDRLAEAGRQVEDERKAAFDVPVPGGLWRIEVPGGNLVGLLRLEARGALVSGDYRLSNGRHGSVSGTFAAGRLELVRVDAKGGRDATLEADVDAARGTFAGTWQRFELASGEPAMGRWSGVRLGPDDEVPELSPE
jgi:hypothetical protein